MGTSMGSQKETTSDMVIVQTRFGEYVLVDSKESKGVSDIWRDIEHKLKNGEGGRTREERRKIYDENQLVQITE